MSREKPTFRAELERLEAQAGREVLGGAARPC